MTDAKMFAALITHPRRAFTELQKTPRFAAPMLVLLAANIALIIWYYSRVDVDWLVNQALAARALTAAQRAQAAVLMTRGTLLGSALLGGVLALIVTQVVEAFYYFFIFEFMDVQLFFREWFAFTWWCSLPQLITVAGAAAMLLWYGHSPAPLGALSPFSLNALFFHLSAADSGYSLLNSITLVELLTMLLMVIGAQTWSKRSWLSCIVIVIAPRLVFYGIWAWFSLR